MLVESASTCRHWAIASPEPFPTSRMLPGLTATMAAYNAAMNACDQGNRWFWFCRTASLHEDRYMVMAVMALIIWKLWQVTMIMILIYDIPKLFLVPSKKQTGQLGCQCGVFFPFVRQLALLPDILTGTALLSSPWHSALWVLSAGSLDTSWSL